MTDTHTAGEQVQEEILKTVRNSQSAVVAAIQAWARANGIKLSFHWCKIAAWRGQGSRWWLATGWRTVSGSGF